MQLTSQAVAPQSSEARQKHSNTKIICNILTRSHTLAHTCIHDLVQEHLREAAAGHSSIQTHVQWSSFASSLWVPYRKKELVSEQLFSHS